MRIFFYGIGRFYQKRRETLFSLRQGDTFLGFIDKRAAECRTFDGAHVYLPEEALQEVFDAIVVTNASFCEIKNELRQQGVAEEKILIYKAYLAIKGAVERREYGEFGNLQGKKILLAMPSLGYHGGAIALVHAALALQGKGYRVTLISETIDKRLLREIVKYPIKVIDISTIRYVSVAQLAFLQAYDIIVANVFPMVRFAIRAAHWRPVLWWLHECQDVYPEILDEFTETKDDRLFSHLRIAAVSKRAQANFEHYYPGRVDTILPYCLPNRGQDFRNEPHESVTFAIIGGVCKRKAQDVFLQAVALLPQQLREKAEFRIIGSSDGEDAYSAAVREAAAKEPRVRFCGVLNRVEMREAFRTIDVVVCASREECLPTTMAEGMMYRKICIATDASGMDDVIKSGENGFVVPVEDAEALAGCMAGIIEQPERYADMRAAARRTYEEYFTPKIFAARLKAELEKTVKSWKEGPCG
ncbi:glycosyltransferase family 4 protein [Selenomonas bovis]|uniref:glycosyltransferase family 4 protein n=1 Tax=Selenomonas bovis TaxID=416586 RepID=UPI003D06C1A6